MRFALRIASGPRAGRRFELGRERVSIGRDGANDIVIADLSVSRVHASLERRGAEFVVRDEGSANGTELNGRALAGVAVLRRGDRIRVGGVVLVFDAARRSSRVWATCALSAMVAAALLLRRAPLRPQPSLAAEARPEEAPGDPQAARFAWDRGRHKLRERRIAPRNLFDAWKAFVEAKQDLESVAPRPALYEEVAKLAALCERELAQLCNKLVFAAERLERLGDDEKAQQAWRDVLLSFPADDPSGCRTKARRNVAADAEP